MSEGSIRSSGPSSGVVDRRSVVRNHIPYRMDVSDGDGAPVGYLVDISSEGMRVRFRQGLDAGRVERLRIQIPRWMALGEELLVGGRFLWCKPFGIGTTEGGFVFEGLDGNTLTTIDALVETVQRAEREDR